MEHVIRTVVIPASEGRGIELEIISQGRTSWPLEKVLAVVQRENPSLWKTWDRSTATLMNDPDYWDRLDLSEEEGYPALDEWIFQRKATA